MQLEFSTLGWNSSWQVQIRCSPNGDDAPRICHHQLNGVKTRLCVILFLSELN